MDMGLNDKTAFISGSTQGIGYAVARALAAEGALVALNGRTTTTVDSAVERLCDEVPGARVRGLAADFADRSQVDGLLRELDEVDVLINNVGVFEVEAFNAVDDLQWQHYFDVNVMSGVRTSRHALPGMLRRGWGRVIFISSESGGDVPADMIHYGTTKAAMMALGNGLAKLTRGTDVTVNTILGGPTFSDGVADTVDQTAQAQGIDALHLKTAIATRNQTSLLQRFIEPAEIAQLALYLASPLSSATNGAALRADGGTLTTTL